MRCGAQALLAVLCLAGRNAAAAHEDSALIALPGHSAVALQVSCDGTLNPPTLANALALELPVDASADRPATFSVTCLNNHFKLRATRAAQDGAPSLEQWLVRSAAPENALERTLALALAEMDAVLRTVSEETDVGEPSTTSKSRDHSDAPPAKRSRSDGRSRRAKTLPREPELPRTTAWELAPDALVPHEPEDAWELFLEVGPEFRKFRGEASLSGAQILLGLGRSHLGVSVLMGGQSTSVRGTVAALYGFIDLLPQSSTGFRFLLGPRVSAGFITFDTTRAAQTYVDGGAGLGTEFRLARDWRIALLGQGGFASGATPASDAAYDGPFGALSLVLGARP